MLGMGMGSVQGQCTPKDLQVKLLIDIAKDNGLEVTAGLFRHILDKVYGSGPLDNIFSAALNAGATDTAGSSGSATGHGMETATE